MPVPYLGEIRCFSFFLVPKGWALCNGALLLINENQALFAILGTAYGGDGRVTFGLPNLQGRVPAHVGNGFIAGNPTGESNHTLITSEMPAHIHPIVSDIIEPGGAPEQAATPSTTAFIGTSNPDGIYNTSVGDQAVALANNVLSSVGGSQPHPNQQPFLVLSFCIALSGMFPSRN